MDGTPERSRALLPALFCSLLPLSEAFPAGADVPLNSIRSIQTVHTGRLLITYVITLTSSALFPRTTTRS